MSEETPRHNHFIRQIVAEDKQTGKHDHVVTRFPPEPNGYLHLGHAKSICLNFGIASDFGGVCHLRFDDTNPAKEDIEYVEAIKDDVRWLGFEWDELRHASDYFGVLYECALKLIDDGNAFVCDLSAEQQREYRGTLTEPGRNSPFRDRSVEENLDLFARMRAGEFADGAKTLRAKIDMASGNINLRDPAIYRIRKSRTRTPATPGRSIRCTTSRIGCPMPSKASPTRCARSNSRTIGRCTTGAWRRWTWNIIRN